MKYLTLLSNALKEIENGYEKSIEDRNGIMTNVKPTVEYIIIAEDDPDVSVYLKHSLEGMKNGYLGEISSLLTKEPLTNFRGKISMSGAMSGIWSSEYRFRQLEEANNNLSQLGIPYFLQGHINVPVTPRDNVKNTNQIDFDVAMKGNPSTLHMRQSHHEIFEDELRKETTQKRFGKSHKQVVLKPNPYATQKITELANLLKLINVTDIFYSPGISVDPKILLEILKNEDIRIDCFSSDIGGKKIPDIPEMLGVEYEGKSGDVSVNLKKERMNFELKAQVDAFDTPKLTEFCEKFENVFVDHCEDKR